MRVPDFANKMYLNVYLSLELKPSHTSFKYGELWFYRVFFCFMKPSICLMLIYTTLHSPHCSRWASQVKFPSYIAEPILSYSQWALLSYGICHEKACAPQKRNILNCVSPLRVKLRNQFLWECYVMGSLAAPALIFVA